MSNPSTHGDWVSQVPCALLRLRDRQCDNPSLARAEIFFELLNNEQRTTLARWYESQLLQTLKQLLEDELAYLSILDRPIGDNEPLAGDISLYEIFVMIRDTQIDDIAIKEALIDELGL